MSCVIILTSALVLSRQIPKSERPLPTNPVEASIPDAPTYYPTEEQFRDPLAYVHI